MWGIADDFILNIPICCIVGFTATKRFYKIEMQRKVLFSSERRHWWRIVDGSNRNWIVPSSQFSQPSLSHFTTLEGRVSLLLLKTFNCNRITTRSKDLLGPRCYYCLIIYFEINLWSLINTGCENCVCRISKIYLWVSYYSWTLYFLRRDDRTILNHPISDHLTTTLLER